jgi:hypothetical protein
MKVVAQEAINYVEGRRNNTVVSLQTRWKKFNKQCMGGIEPNTIYTFGGISGTGNKISINCNQTDFTLRYVSMNTKHKNEHYFDSIDTEEKAYWLGFIYADGNVSKPTRKVGDKIKAYYRIEVSLKEDDLEHLEKLRMALDMEAPVKTSHTNFKQSTRARLGWNSKHMWEVLNSYGCTPCKSLTLTFPNIDIFKDKRLIRHFIRGYVDGDGCISYCDNDHKRAHLSILGTESMLSNIQHWLPLQYELQLFEKSNVKQLAFVGKTAFYIENYLYKNSSVKLDRKYNRYLEHCRLYLEEYGLQLGKYGELWEENAVVNSEITKGSESPYSVETE